MLYWNFASSFQETWRTESFYQMKQDEHESEVILEKHPNGDLSDEQH